MCLPDDMTFQYFFFDTYPGYFLQALPAALLAGALFVLLRVRRNGRETLVKSLIPALFVCYLAGLVCLTLFLDVMGEVYYFLFCHMPGGRHIHWFSGSLDFDLVLSLGSEQIGDFLMFLPFGILYPLFRPGSTLPRTIAAGAAAFLFILRETKDEGRGTGAHF